MSVDMYKYKVVLLNNKGEVILNKDFDNVTEYLDQNLIVGTINGINGEQVIKFSENTTLWLTKVKVVVG